MSAPDKSWVEEARRLIDGGMSITLTARTVGKSDNAVRWNLDLNNYRAKRKAYNDAARARTAAGPSKEKKLAPATINRNRWERDAPSAPLSGKVTLPLVSILASAEPELGRVIRFAPKTRIRTEPAGVAAIRAVHLRMIRAGKIAQPGIPLEMRS